MADARPENVMSDAEFARWFGQDALRDAKRREAAAAEARARAEAEGRPYAPIRPRVTLAETLAEIRAQFAARREREAQGIRW